MTLFSSVQLQHSQIQLRLCELKRGYRIAGSGRDKSFLNFIGLMVGGDSFGRVARFQIQIRQVAKTGRQVPFVTHVSGFRQGVFDDRLQGRVGISFFPLPSPLSLISSLLKRQHQIRRTEF